MYAEGWKSPKQEEILPTTQEELKDRLALARDVARVKTVLYTAVALGLGAIWLTENYNVDISKNDLQQGLVAPTGQQRALEADFNHPAFIKCQDEKSLLSVKLVKGEKGEPKEAIVYCKPVAEPAK